MLEAGAVLSPNSWPESEEEKLFFGEKQVLRLAEIFHIDKREAVAEFRIYKNNSKNIGSTLSLLLQRVKLLPVSSAECERGFSCMNNNDTPVRNRLSVESLSALIFVKCNGPEPTHFNPKPYAEAWIKQGRHAATDAATGKPSQNKPMASSMSTLFL